MSSKGQQQCTELGQDLDCGGEHLTHPAQRVWVQMSMDGWAG